MERFVPFYKNYASQINQIFQSGNRYLLADRITDVNRSISFLGFERPLVFSPENAVLGRTIFCLSSSLIILFEKFKERIIFAIFIAFTFFLFGSPMCLFFLPTALISELFIKNEFQIKFYRIKILYILFLLMGSLLVSYNFLRIRIESFLSLINSQILPFSFLRENSSEYLRLVLPIQSLREILNENPFFGIGFGAHNYLQELFFGRTIYGAEAFNGNNFLYPLFSFGLFGTIIFILIIKSNFPKKFDKILQLYLF